MTADVTGQAQRAALFAATVAVSALMITEGCHVFGGRRGRSPRGRRRPARDPPLGVGFLLSGSRADDGLGREGSIGNVLAPDHMRSAALLDAVRSNGWNQLCFRSYSRAAAEVAAERIAAMIDPFVDTINGPRA
jgi:hypothetical protein